MWDSKRLLEYANEQKFKCNSVDQQVELQNAVNSFGIDHGDNILKWLFKYEFLKIQMGFAWDGDKESLGNAIENKQKHFKLDSSNFKKHPMSQIELNEIFDTMMATDPHLEGMFHPSEHYQLKQVAMRFLSRVIAKLPTHQRLPISDTANLADGRIVLGATFDDTYNVVWDETYMWHNGVLIGSHTNEEKTGLTHFMLKPQIRHVEDLKTDIPSRTLVIHNNSAERMKAVKEMRNAVSNLKDLTYRPESRKNTFSKHFAGKIRDKNKGLI